MTELAQEISETIRKYRGDAGLEEYTNRPTTDLLKKGPKEDLDQLYNDMGLSELDRLYESSGTTAEALEQALELGEQWEKRVTDYFLQRATVDSMADLTIE